MPTRRRRPYVIQVDEEEDDDNDGGDEEYHEEDGDVEDADPSYVPDDAHDSLASSTGAPVTEELWNREGRERRSSDRHEIGESSASGECSQREVDGLCCPICLQAWTSDGGHHVCCLPCGHIYGMSCIKKWLRQRKSSSKCPQCNRKCALKDVIKLYASRIVVLDDEAQQEIQSLEAKCASLEAKCTSLESVAACWLRKESDWCQREATLFQQVDQLSKRSTYLQHALEDIRSKPAGFVGNGGRHPVSLSDEIASKTFVEGCFMLQEEMQVDGARLFDLDASDGILIVARRHPNIPGQHLLTKISLTSPCASEDLVLSPSVKFVKDLQLSPSGGLVLLASLGKKLSVYSMDTNNAVLAYDLPAPAWSCSWDLRSPYHVYTGLQNGVVLVFDTRQTASPLHSYSGFTRNAIHTLHTLRDAKSCVLATSSAGLYELSLAPDGRGPMPVEHEGVCISSAYSTADHIVSTYRPKVDMSSNLPSSQYPATPCSTGHQVQGSHVLFKRKDCCEYEKLATTTAPLDEIRLTKSAIVCGSGSHAVFAYPDEATNQLVLYELARFRVAQRLEAHDSPVRDVRFTQDFNSSGGLLGCLSQNKMQFYSAGY